MSAPQAEIIHGDCLDVMRGMAAGSVDTIITDPPYGLKFMGREWDHGVPGVPFWTEALRVAKPGAYLLAFGGTRTWHRLAVAIEDAGWEIRDTMSWLYGSGFPKSLDISKALDKAAGAEREVVGQMDAGPDIRGDNYGRNNGQRMIADITLPATPLAQTWDGYGTALKPAWEPIIVAMKPCEGTFAQNAAEHGVAGLWIDGARVGNEERPRLEAGFIRRGRTDEEVFGTGYGRPKEIHGTVSGRWPANLVLDEEAGRLLDAMSGERKGATSNSDGGADSRGTYGKGWTGREKRPGYADTGGASRFFQRIEPDEVTRFAYHPKASRAERNAGLEGMEESAERNYEGGNLNRPEHLGSDGVRRSGKRNPRANTHPTVKPVALMRWLARLTRPPHGGTVLDPFAGSGSTGVACIMEGRAFIGIELEADYVAIARARLDHATQQAQQLPLAVGAD